MSLAWTKNNAGSKQVDQEATDLRSEYGWHEIQSGLARILAGYGVLIVGGGFCLGLVLIAGLELVKNPTRLGFLWLLYLGLGLISVVSMVGYGLIVVGKWRCLLNAPERQWTRWWMFGCMTCLLMGPGLNLAANLTGLKEKPNFKRGPDGIVSMKFTKLGTGLALAGGFIGLSSFILFLLFLRAVAGCFGDGVRMTRITAFLICSILLAVGSLALVLAAPKVALKPSVLCGLVGGWLAIFMGYLYFIASARNCIVEGLAQLRSPLDVKK